MAPRQTPNKERTTRPGTQVTKPNSGASQQADATLVSRANSLLDGRHAFGIVIENPRNAPLPWIILGEEDVAELVPLDLDALSDALATKLSLPNHKEDTIAQLIVSQFVYTFAYSQKLNLTPMQTSTLISMSKAIFDLPGGTGGMELAVEALRDMISNHTIFEEKGRKRVPEDVAGGGVNWEVFPKTLVPEITRLAKYGPLQHHRLYQSVYTTEQEKAQLDCLAIFEVPFDVGSMLGALPIEVWEAQQEAERVRLEQERQTTECKRIEERLATQNIFTVLGPERVKALTTEIVGKMLGGISEEMEGLLAQQRQKFLATLSKEV